MTMEKKYELLLDDSIIHGIGKTLYRIRALKDFSNVKKGDLGGYVESEENLSHDGDCWIYGYGKVYEYARVYEDASISMHALIRGYSSVYGTAMVKDHSNVFGNAKIHDNAIVSGNSLIYDSADIYEDAFVSGDCIINRNAKIHGTASIRDYSYISLNADIKTNDEVAYVSNFGTENRPTTFYHCNDNTIRVCCGCFKGTIDEFRNKVKSTRKGYIAKEYLMIADLMEYRFKHRLAETKDKSHYKKFG